MLTKTDLNQLKNIFDTSLDSKLDSKLEPIKKDISSLKQDVSVLKQDVSVLKQDVSVLKQDVSSIKYKLDDLYNFSVLAFGNIFDWIEDIHHVIVKKDLPKRVKKLEQYFRS